MLGKHWQQRSDYFPPISVSICRHIQYTRSKEQEFYLVFRFPKTFIRNELRWRGSHMKQQFVKQKSVIILIQQCSLGFSKERLIITEYIFQERVIALPKSILCPKLLECNTEGEKYAKVLYFVSEETSPRISNWNKLSGKRWVQIWVQMTFKFF